MRRWPAGWPMSASWLSPGLQRAGREAAAGRHLAPNGGGGKRTRSRLLATSRLLALAAHLRLRSAVGGKAGHFRERIDDPRQEVLGGGGNVGPLHGHLDHRRAARQGPLLDAEFFGLHASHRTAARSSDAAERTV